MAPLDYHQASRQIAESEKRRPKKYRNSAWRFYDSYFRGAQYLVDPTGIGFLRHAGQCDVENMRHCAKGIMKFQMEIGLPVSSFTDLGLYEIEDNAEETMGLSNNEEHDDTKI